VRTSRASAASNAWLYFLLDGGPLPKGAFVRGIKLRTTGNAPSYVDLGWAKAGRPNPINCIAIEIPTDQTSLTIIPIVFDLESIAATIDDWHKFTSENQPYHYAVTVIEIVAQLMTVSGALKPVEERSAQQNAALEKLYLDEFYTEVGTLGSDDVRTGATKVAGRLASDLGVRYSYFGDLIQKDDRGREDKISKWLASDRWVIGEQKSRLELLGDLSDPTARKLVMSPSDKLELPSSCADSDWRGFTTMAGDVVRVDPRGIEPAVKQIRRKKCPVQP
jgi:hypothetical protein